MEWLWSVFVNGARFITFFAVVVAWVIFRADNLDAALRVYEGMLGHNGFPINAVARNLLEFLKDRKILALGP